LNSIYLQYGTYANGVITWSSSQHLSPSRLIEQIETKKNKGYDLRDIPFINTISTRTKSIKITITPLDLLNQTNLNWIYDFYKADAWRYNLTDVNWDTASIRVELEEQGIMPVEYIEDNKNLKLITLTLKQWFPDV